MAGKPIYQTLHGLETGDHTIFTTTSRREGTDSRQVVRRKSNSFSIMCLVVDFLLHSV